MSNQSERKALIRSLRRKRRECTDEKQKEQLLKEILAAEDELLRVEFEDDNVQRFNEG